MNDTPKTVLIVDDDTDFVEATRVILESNAYDVKTARSREEAMQEITQDKPDLILLDVMMKRMNDGFTLCHELKHDEQLKKIPVIMITSVTQSTGLRFSPGTDGEYLEAEDYMDKPVEAPDLLAKIDRLLKRQDEKGAVCYAALRT